MPGEANLRLAVLYPDQLNIYADRGNIRFLELRCAWRGIGFELVRVGPGEQLDDADVDMIYIGGGQDRDQAICAKDLVGSKAEKLRRWYADGKPLLAVCGGYQLLGSHYESPTGRIEGAGAAPLTTGAGSKRLIGPIAIQTDLGGPTDGLLAGFENHVGLTQLAGDAKPLGQVINGHGNDGESGFEGVRNGSAIGTYLHGPLLPKNWWLADWLIAASIAVNTEDLPVLNEEFERNAHRSAARAAGISS